jgi:hypothetical protein
MDVQVLAVLGRKVAMFTGSQKSQAEKIAEDCIYHKQQSEQLTLPPGTDHSPDGSVAGAGGCTSSQVCSSV